MSRRTPVSAAAMRRLGWTRVDPRPWSKLSARWEHVAGWTLTHCGHPTAHWPWVLLDPKGRMVLTGIAGPHKRADFGTAWPDLKSAAQWLAGQLPASERGKEAS